MSGADVPDALVEDAEELYEDAPCGYLSTSPDGTIRRVNRTFLSWSGYDADELVGRRRFYDLLPPGAKIYYETHYAPLLQMQGTVREIALELIRADGGRLPVLINATTKNDASGRPLFIRITVFDASDRRRYERELLHARAEAERRAAAATALEHVAEGVLLVDDDGRIRLLNPAAERIFATPAGEALGMPLTAVWPGWLEIAPRIPLGAGVEVPPTSVLVPLELPNGTRWLDAAAMPTQDGVVYTLRDVTEERQLDELRDDIVAIVSHELRTPLSVVYGSAQTLSSLGDRLSEEQRSELIAGIAEQSGRLTRIVEEIHLTQRLAASEVVVDRRAFRVDELVERLVAQTHSQRASQPIELKVAEGVEAEGDPALFEQVLVNLIDNAIKHAPGSAVRVEVGPLGASVRVTVADDGPGVPQADQERIFERFLRLDPEQRTGAAGIGLGLYIARELVGRMHGRIGLLPATAGAMFYVDLPRHHPS